MAGEDKVNGSKDKYRGDGLEICIQNSPSPNAASFKWLGREARGSTYTSYTQVSDRPGCSFDFGSNGYTASCNLGGELLRFTIPSDKTGLISATAQVDESLSSKVASAQSYKGNDSTFGLKFLSISPDTEGETKVDGRKKDNYVLGALVERGAINNRWPLHEYALVHEAQKHIEIGTCVLFSFVQNCILHQIMRLEQVCRPGATSCLLLQGSDVISVQLVLPSKFRQRMHPRDLFIGENIGIHFRIYRGEPGNLQEHKFAPSDIIGNTLRIPISMSESNIKAGQPIIVILSLQLHETPRDISRLKPQLEAEKLPELTSQRVHDWIGFDPSNDWATGAMWETIFFRRESMTDCVSKLCEVNLVARCLEKIQHVDAVLLPRGNPDKARPLALISNTICGPELDMQALFWKVRFLVKTRKFLSKNHEANFLPDRRDSAADLDFHRNSGIAGLHSQLIESDIERILSFVISFLQPWRKWWPVFLMRQADFRSPYYVMITIWYLIKNGFGQTSTPGMRSLKKEGSWLDKILPAENFYLDKDTEGEVLMLKWMYYGSISQLMDQSGASGSWLHITWGGDSRLLRDRVHVLRRAAKIALAAKVSSKRPYVPSDEAVDRLAFLAHELDLEQENSGAHICSLVMRRVLNRAYTKAINPGSKDLQDQISCDADVSAPWELFPLSHHSRLLMANLESKRPGEEEETATQRRMEEVEKYRSKFSMFLTANASLIPCWERASLASGRAWRASETPAVLAATLLDIYLKDIQQPSTTQRESCSVLPDHSSQVVDAARPSENDCQSHPATQGSRRVFSTKEEELEYLWALNCKSVACCAETDESPQNDWVQFKPPRRYHPRHFIWSLDRSPEKYTKGELVHVRIPSTIRQYLWGRHRSESETQGWTVERLRGVIKQDASSEISLMDISANDRSDGRGGTVQGLVFFGRLNPLKKPSQSSRPRTAEFDTAGAGNESDYTSSTLNDHAKTDLVEAISRSVSCTKTPLSHGQFWLTKNLPNKLVDREVQHRMIVIPNLRNKDLVELLIYVLHRGSTDCIANHMFKFTRFSLHVGSPWIASITVRSWVLKDIENNKAPETEDGCMGSEDDPIHIQGSDKREQALIWLKKSRKIQEGLTEQQPEATEKQIVLDVSSIVISTTAFGDFSKTTIVSKTLSAVKLRYAGFEAQKLWRVFVHQPQTARCLVFLMLLGLLCQEIAQQYNDAADYLANILHLDSNLDPDQYAKCHDSVEMLGVVLWCLDALEKLRNSLDATVNGVEQAKQYLMAQISERKDKRSQALESICQVQLGAFETKFLELTAAAVRLRSRVEVNHRHGEAASALLQLEQNKTIQRLTYVTIVYLPLGVVTAIFAIPETQNVVYSSMGLGWYIGALGILLSSTIAVAFASKIIKIIQIDGRRHLRNLWSLATWHRVIEPKSPA